MATSFVSELVQLAYSGELSDSDLDQETVSVAMTLVAQPEGIGDVTELLMENNCDAAAAFGAEVTPETESAYEAYIQYCC